MGILGFSLKSPFSYTTTQAENQVAKAIALDSNDNSHVDQIIASEKQEARMQQRETQEIQKDMDKKRAIMSQLLQLEKIKVQENERATLNTFLFENPQYSEIYMRASECQVSELQSVLEAYRNWTPSANVDNNNDNYVGDGWDKDIVEEEED